MRKEIRVMNSHIDDAKEIAVCIARRYRRVFLLSVTSRHSTDYNNLVESVCREKFLEEKPDCALPSPLMTDEDVYSNGDDSEISS